VEKPTFKDNEVLIRIHAASVDAYDWHLRTADIFVIRLMGGGLLKPKDTRLGADMAGRAEAAGRNIRQFRPGERCAEISTIFRTKGVSSSQDGNITNG